MKALTIPEIAQCPLGGIFGPDFDPPPPRRRHSRLSRRPVPWPAVPGKKGIHSGKPPADRAVPPLSRGVSPAPPPSPGRWWSAWTWPAGRCSAKGRRRCRLDLLSWTTMAPIPALPPGGTSTRRPAACGEIIYRVLTAMGLRLDRPTAEALYVAVSTDTGCFRYSNTTAHTLQVAAACLEAGAKHLPTSTSSCLKSTRLCRLRLETRLYGAAPGASTRAEPWRCACMPLRGGARKAGVTEDDLEDVSGFARNVEGVQLAVTFREPWSVETPSSPSAPPPAMTPAAGLRRAWGAAATPAQPEPPCTATRPRPGPGFWRCSRSRGMAQPCDPRLERRPHGHWNHSHR